MHSCLSQSCQFVGLFQGQNHRSPLHLNLGKPLKNHWFQWLIFTKTFNGDGPGMVKPLKNHWWQWCLGEHYHPIVMKKYQKKWDFFAKRGGGLNHSKISFSEKNQSIQIAWGRGVSKLLSLLCLLIMYQKSSTPPSISLLRGSSVGALAI